MDMNALMRQAQQMQRNIEKAKEEFDNREFNFTAAGGAIELVIKGNKTLSSINIDESLSLSLLIETVVNFVLMIEPDAPITPNIETLSIVGFITSELIV